MPTAASADRPQCPDLRLVLASGSPRRRELLGGLGLTFEVRPVDLDESVRAGEAPREYVRRLAIEKGAARVEAGEVVLSADTIVVLDGEILGKPTDEAHAREMLARIAGRRHAVYSGVALHLAGGNRAPGIDPEPRSVVTVERTEVRIGALTIAEIADYVATGEPLDKAGSYAIQGVGMLLVEEIEGNYTNVVGLPLPATARLFSEFGLDLRSFSASAVPTRP